MNPNDIKQKATEALELSEKATSGPWKTWIMDVMHDPVGDSNHETSIPVATTFKQVDGKPRTMDCDFIAQSRTLLPELAQAVIELCEENARYREALKFYADHSQWVSSKCHSSDASVIYNDTELIPAGPALFPTGGKVAREALKEGNEK